MTLLHRVYTMKPAFVQCFTMFLYVTRFHMHKDSLHDIKQSIDCVPTKLGDTILSSIKTKNSGGIWGLDHIVSHVNPKVIEAYIEPVQSSSVSNDHVYQETNQQVYIYIKTLKIE